MKKENLFEILKHSIASWKDENTRSDSLIQLDKKISGLSSEDWNNLIETAKKHGVLGVICDTIENLKGVSDIVKKRTQEYSRRICQLNYRLFIVTKSIIEEFEKNGIKSCALKGIAIASEYEIPELRKSGDIDILISKPEEISAAVSILENKGFVKDDKQWTLHHVAMTNKDNVVVEIHTMLAEPFDDKSINHYMEMQMNGIENHIKKSETIGVTFAKLDDSYHGYELLLHMIQHFLNAGFGLKLLCDWVRFWSREHNEIDKTTYLKLVRESGVKKFSDIVTKSCVDYLGLRAEMVEWMNLDEYGNENIESLTESFIDEVFDAEEFGRQNRDRVVAVRGTGLSAYWKEFHHQMRNSFPRASKCFLTWPVLWIVTFFRFVRNNQKVRKVSTMQVIRSAGGRGNLVESMNLFKM